MPDPSDILFIHVKACQRVKELREKASTLYAKGKKREAAKLREEAQRLGDIAEALAREVRPVKRF